MSHRVRYHEADGQGFLFNGRYLEIADVAMTEFFRSLGFDYQEMVAGGMDPSVVSATLTFRSPARFDEVLDVHVRCCRVGTSSFELETLVTRDEQPLAQMRLVYVNVDPVTARSRPLPSSIERRLRALTDDAAVIPLSSPPGPG
jgi:acyl-CoA thioester hydrolase